MTTPRKGPTQTMLPKESRSGRVLRLSDPELRVKMAAIDARIARDPAYARSLLERAGIVTKSGRLTKNFGG